jgi:L-aminopeptidase/D-esterase-like protein
VTDRPPVDIGIAGVLVGHHTDEAARTGCTVVLFPEGSIASGEVRGGAPATREFALLDPTRTVEHIDAVVLSGGSAFGLAACDGVMRWCAAHDRGFATRAGRVPIVVSMSLYDLTQGDPSVRPTADDGARAAAAAAAGPVAWGALGAGTGATVGKWRGAEAVRPGGVGIAVVRRAEVVVAAVVAVNAVGDIDDGSVAAAILDGSFAWPAPPEAFGAPAGAPPDEEPTGRVNTTIGVLVTNAALDKVGCQLLAQSGHDGLARALFPAHARSDGDALVAVSVPVPRSVPVPVSEAAPEPRAASPDEVPPGQLDTVRILGTLAVEQAVRSLA